MFNSILPKNYIANNKIIQSKNESQKEKTIDSNQIELTVKTNLESVVNLKTDKGESNNNISFVDDKSYETIQVKPSDNIQEIINNIPPNSKIKLEKGIYNQDLSIMNKKGITLIGSKETVINGSININGSEDIKISGIKLNSEGLGKNTKTNKSALIISGKSKKITIEKMDMSHKGGYPKGGFASPILDISPDSSEINITKNNINSSNVPLTSLIEGDNNLVVNAIRSRGKNVNITGNNIENINTGISSGGENAFINNNKIDNFNQDGIQIYGHNSEVSKNEITNLVDLSHDKAHHDGIQAWATKDRYTGRGNLENITIKDNLIISSTDKNRSYQGVLQGIAAFDGYMDGWKIESNEINTHSSIHGITITGARKSKENDFIIKDNKINVLESNFKINDSKPGINLFLLRYKEDPKNPKEAWNWLDSKEYSVTLSNNKSDEYNIPPSNNFNVIIEGSENIKADKVTNKLGSSLKSNIVTGNSRL